MAEWRRVYAETWGDKKIVRLSRDARLLFVGLITLADDEGYVEGDPHTIRLDIFRGDDDLTDADVASLRDELVAASLLTRHDTETDTYLWIPNWEKRQHPRKDMRKPSKIKWHIDKQPPCNPAVTDPLRTRYGPVTQSRVEESREDLVDATHLPADAGKTETPKPQKPDRSPAQKQQDRDLEDLKAAWTARWPRVVIPTYPMLAEVITGCKRVGCSPAWLIGQAPVHLEHPDRLLRMWVNGTSPMPERTDGHGSWHQWTERHKTGMRSITDILHQQEGPCAPKS